MVGVLLSLTRQAMAHLRATHDIQAAAVVVLRILPTCVFNKKDPIVLGVDVVDR
jgi:translation initiation factor IF-2